MADCGYEIEGDIPHLLVSIVKGRTRITAFPEVLPKAIKTHLNK